MSDDRDVEFWRKLRLHRTATFIVAMVLTCALGVLDFVLPRGIPLLLAYLFPVALVGAASSRKVIVFSALSCTVVAEWSDTYVWNLREGIARDALTLIAFLAVGFYVHEFVTKQETERLHYNALSDENTARIEAEEQLTLLIGNSALAILSMNDDGVVLQANEAAQRIFAGRMENDAHITGKNVKTLLPSLVRVMARAAEGRSVRTMMQAQGVRLDGDPFLAEVWFSNYSTRLGRRTAAMVVDVSEEFRSREESITEQLLNNSRLAVGAMAHEMRNVVGAIQMVLQSLCLETPAITTTANMLAMRELMSTLETMSSVQLSQVRRTAARISLNQFLSELQVVAQAILAEDDIAFHWGISSELPSVWADSEGLMQVFLNLLRNSRAALQHTENAWVRIESAKNDGHIAITLIDNGPGIDDPEKLFHPFQPGSPVANLGLYLSRAIVNSFHGELRFLPAQEGAIFQVELEVVHG
ncbi:MAG TPA: PAS domain-containing sensor histidine kinase [Terriglobus sp.]